MMVFAYDEAFTPPAPVPDLQVSAVGASVFWVVHFPVDSGADISVLPDDVISELQLRRVGFTGAGGFDSASVERLVYSASIQFSGSGTPRLSRVLAWNETYGLLGRDFLNAWRVVLDGPQLRLQLEGAAS